MPFGRYRVWVRGYDAANVPSAWSAPIEFSIGPQPMAPLGPTFESTPTFEWTTIPGAATYELYLSTAGGIVQQTGLTGSSWTPAGPLPNGILRWWVRGATGGGTPGAWSDRIDSDIGGRPVMQTPTGTGSDASPELHVDCGGRSDVVRFVCVETRRAGPGVSGRQPDDEFVRRAGFFPTAITECGCELTTEPASGRGAVRSTSPSTQIPSPSTQLRHRRWSPPSTQLRRSPGPTKPEPPRGTSSSPTAQPSSSRQGCSAHHSPSAALWPPATGRGGCERKTARTTPVRGALRLRCTSEDEPSSWPRSEPPSTTLQCSSGPLLKERAATSCTSKPAGGTVVIREDNLVGTSYEAPAPMAAGNYRFWVKAINAADNTSGFWSQPTNFTIVNADQFTLPFGNGNDNNGEREAAGNSLLANLLQVPLAEQTATVRFNPPTVPTQLSPQSKPELNPQPESQPVRHDAPYRRLARENALRSSAFSPTQQPVERGSSDNTNKPQPTQQEANHKHLDQIMTAELRLLNEV